MDHCYGVYNNENGKWVMKNTHYINRHQFEIILNFPGGFYSFFYFSLIALDFGLDPAPLPPPPSSAYIAITPVLNAPSENDISSQKANPYNKDVDMSIVVKATEKKPVEIARNSSAMVFFSLTSSIASTVVSNKPIVAKTTEGYQSIYRSTSETIMPFIPVICLYFGDGICPKAYGIHSEDRIIDRIIQTSR